uniref:Uncharacterized protein n=1 Tax=Arundo donax TaxID=35708 RepID=A0A0A9CTF2_ARUDO
MPNFHSFLEAQVLNCTCFILVFLDYLNSIIKPSIMQHSRFFFSFD